MTEYIDHVCVVCEGALDDVEVHVCEWCNFPVCEKCVNYSRSEGGLEWSPEGDSSEVSITKLIPYCGECDEGGETKLAALAARGLPFKSVW